MGEKVKVLLWLFLIGSTTAELIIKGEWKENFGWELSCTWQTLINDTLQSIKMYRNGQEILVYRPEVSGPNYSNTSQYDQLVLYKNCRLSSSDGKRGKCTIKVDLRQNATEDTYRCETSGERPLFRWEAQEYHAYAPPTAAEVNQIQPEDGESHAPIVNCTSTGLPPPKLLWTVEGQKVPEDFAGTTWNSTTKLWHSWSSYNPQKYNVIVTCTPEARTKSGTRQGASTQWVVTDNSSTVETSKFLVLAFSILALLLR